ncbi:site-specific integrase [Dysgonomonas sp. Marseille-P4361]|uniref:site-specific integrase n=1 Tax=Dysgonomonas sp. Marseille-P4361 TaxID=2161820 RepID=UPI000D550529|nr:site-specific integrase [Dysgonomonas sp. Marseille-P4361]
MISNTFILSFILKKSRALKNGEYPIYLRLTIAKERTECSLYRSINPKLWDKQKERVKGNTPLAIEINSFIENVRNQIYQCHLSIEKKGDTVTALKVKNLYLYGEVEKIKKVLDFFNEYLDKIERLKDIELAGTTIQRYRTTIDLFNEYLRLNNKLDLYLDEFNGNIIPEFIYYLKAERRCQHNTVVKYVRSIARMIREAIKKDLVTEKEENLNISIKAEETTPIFLTKDELNRIIEKSFSVERLDIVRDIFIFCCFTGLSFIDAKKLTRNHIERDNKGNYWIRTVRQKTGIATNVVLLNMPLRIIEKYYNNDYCKTNNVLLPIYSNQKHNAYLKEIADLCFINKTLTTHCLRQIVISSLLKYS